MGDYGMNHMIGNLFRLLNDLLCHFLPFSEITLQDEYLLTEIFWLKRELLKCVQQDGKA